MKKISSYLLQAGIIISLEIVSFICFGCNHHLIPNSIFSGAGNVISQLIANILYLLIYFFLYLYIISLTTQTYYNKNKAIKSIAILFVTRIAFDALNLWLSILIVDKAFALSYILESIFLIFMYFLLVKYYSEIPFKNFISTKKSLICSIATSLIIVVLNILYYFSCLDEYDKLISYIAKYNTTAEEMNGLSNNADFICDIRGLCMLTIISILMLILTALVTSQFIKAKKNKSRYNIFVRAFATICIITTAIAMFAILKTLISPTYTLCNIKSGYDGPQYLTENSGFDLQTYDLRLIQINEVGEEVNIYNQEKHDIVYGNKKLLTIKPYYPIEIVSTISGNQLSLNTGMYNIDVENIEAERFCTHAIMYENKNNEPVAILTENIPGIEKDDTVTIILEKLISEGYWDYFEYGCDYLLKYDPEFIKPYIERYAKGEFTETELEISNNIKTEYMISFAQKYTSTVN